MEKGEEWRTRGYAGREALEGARGGDLRQREAEHLSLWRRSTCTVHRSRHTVIFVPGQMVHRSRDMWVSRGVDKSTFTVRLGY